MHTEQNYGDIGKAFDDLSRGIDPVEVRHGDVHDHDVWLERLCCADRLATVAGFTDQLEILNLRQLHCDPLSNDAMVISYEDSYFLHCATPFRIGICSITFVPFPSTLTILTEPPNSATRS